MYAFVGNIEFILLSKFFGIDHLWKGDIMNNYKFALAYNLVIWKLCSDFLSKTLIS